MGVCGRDENRHFPHEKERKNILLSQRTVARKGQSQRRQLSKEDLHSIPLHIHAVLFEGTPGTVASARADYQLYGVLSPHMRNLLMKSWPDGPPVASMHWFCTHQFGLLKSWEGGSYLQNLNVLHYLALLVLPLTFRHMTKAEVFPFSADGTENTDMLSKLVISTGRRKVFPLT